MGPVWPLLGVKLVVFSSFFNSLGPQLNQLDQLNQLGLQEKKMNYIQLIQMIPLGIIGAHFGPYCIK